MIDLRTIRFILGLGVGAIVLCACTKGTLSAVSADSRAPILPTSNSSSSIEVPGPSLTLFNNPYYRCVHNFYVATTGSDSNPGTLAEPWRTIQHADSSSRQGGDCINIEPGNYSGPVYLSYGGSAASNAGYVVYRCTSMDACVVTGSSGFVIDDSAQPIASYLMFDGFELVGSTSVSPDGVAYGQGIQIQSTDELTTSGHHIWATNNIIHGFGQSGIQMNDGEYFYSIHNSLYGNSHVTCDAQGSGISYCVLKAFSNYVPTADDVQNPNPLLRNLGTFHNVVAWNVSHDNMATQCGNASSEYDTDGEGIIMDTFDNQGTTGVLYSNPSLVANNITYQNGGRGIEVFRSYNVTVANNTSYNNMLDPFDNATARGEITISGGQGNTVINNIAYPVPATSISDPRCKGTNPCYLMDNTAFLGGSASGETDANNVWSNNISYGGTPPYVNESGNAIWDPDTINCTTTGSNPNMCNVNPAFASVSGLNFALQSGSPAIGFGLTKNYLSAQSVDVGACAHQLTACP